jgi:hypothetical protein
LRFSVGGVHDGGNQEHGCRNSSHTLRYSGSLVNPGVDISHPENFAPPITTGGALKLWNL